MKKVLITGFGGQLGRAVNEVLMKRNQESKEYEIVCTSSRAACELRLDITNQDEVMQRIEEIKPDIIVNCGAYTAVDLCETEEELAYQVNAVGPKNLSLAANQVDALLIHISTDYVFDGEKQIPYTEEDMKRPLSAYGRTKLAGEQFVEQYCKKYYILRTAWVYGEGKNFVNTMLHLAKNGQIRVVADQYGTPTSAMELARAIEFLMDKKEYGVYHIRCEGDTTWYGFAKEIMTYQKQPVEVIPIETKDFVTKATRPKYSVLSTQKLKRVFDYELMDWKQALKEYMEVK